jgi:hypothetical protein
MKYPLKSFGKGDFLCFWLITFEPIEFHRKNQSLFVDLNEMHLFSKFYVDTRSLMGSGQKPQFFAILNLRILPKIHKLILPMGGFT